MKILILILSFLSMNIFAGYMSKAKLLDCNQDKPFSILLKDCQKEYQDCVVVPIKYHCEKYSEQDTSVDDPSKPIVTKNEIEACIDATDCQAKHAVKSCIDTEEISIKNLDLMEVYCSKDTFVQMIIKQIREDAAKKALYDAAKLDLAAKEVTRATRRQALKAAVATIDSADLAQVKVLLKKLLRDRYTSD